MRLDLNILRQKKIPLHIAVNLGELTPEVSESAISFYNEMTKTGFPILTLSFTVKDESVAKDFFNKLGEQNIFEEQVRTFIIGDWYGLDHKIVEKIKFLIDNTKDFDKQFLNILVNYDGKKELFASMKLLLKKAELKQANIDEVDEAVIKENLFNSYFLPPELIIETGSKYSGLLLWDSPGSKIFFSSNSKNLLKEGIEFFHD